MFAFLVKLVFTLVLWALAALGAVGLFVAGYLALLWPYMENDAGQVRRNAEWDLFNDRLRIDSDAECEEIIRRVNLAVEAYLPEASAYLAVLDAEQRCGDWPDRNLAGSVEFSLSQREYDLTFGERVEMARRRFHREVLGSSGSRSFWRRYYEIEPHCGVMMPNEINAALVEHAKSNPNLTVREARSFMARHWHDCGLEMAALARDGLDSRNARIRAVSVSLMLQAADLLHPNALLWRETVLPDLDPEVYGYFPFERREYSAVGPPMCANDPERRELHRILTGLGQDDATQHWLAMGAPQPDNDLPACRDAIYEVSGTADMSITYPWRGGYDTPFWYAVHAIRTGGEAATAHLPAIEADIGAECIAMARIIAGHVASVLPGPPQDIPVARQMIDQSLACQPEDMRDAAAYPDGVYAPVETLLFPSFEPRFVPVQTAE